MSNTNFDVSFRNSGGPNDSGDNGDGNGRRQHQSKNIIGGENQKGLSGVSRVKDAPLASTSKESEQIGIQGGKRDLREEVEVEVFLPEDIPSIDFVSYSMRQRPKPLTHGPKNLHKHGRMLKFPDTWHLENPKIDYSRVPLRETLEYIPSPTIDVDEEVEEEESSDELASIVKEVTEDFSSKDKKGKPNSPIPFEEFDWDTFAPSSDMLLDVDPKPTESLDELINSVEESNNSFITNELKSPQFEDEPIEDLLINEYHEVN